MSDDRRHVVIDLGGGRQFQALIPKDADTIDILNFIEHLKKLAREQEEERRGQ